MKTRSMSKKIKLAIGNDIIAMSVVLPDDIIAEILQRVSSIKLLLRFTCLSKSWYSFISSQKFIKTHLQKSVTKHAIFISSFRRHFVVDRYPVDVLFSEQPVRDHDLVQFELHYNKIDDGTRVIGCSNGLCCILVCQKDFVLLNPFTRKSFKLPLPFERYENGVRGFGYDESNDDYKVLVRSPCRNFFSLYSLKTNSWKTLNNFIGSTSILSDFLDHQYNKATGVLVNGKLHWAVKSGNSLKIVSFDLGSESVGMVEPPSRVNGSLLNWTMLGVIEGYLCVFHADRVKGTEIWRMMEYGIKESWYHVVTVPNLIQRHPDRSYLPPYPLYITDEGDVVVLNGCKLIYNPKIKSPRPLNIRNPRKHYAIGMCIQSLVSPYPPVV